MDIDLAVELTELEKLEVTRVDAVGRPANGFPVLMMKGIAAPPVAKGQRDCPECDKSYHADHQGGKCENCGADLPDADASKAAGDKTDCPTCKGDGKIMGDKRDCPDCDASGKVTPDKAKTLAAKSLVKAIVGRKVDEAPDIAGGTAVLAQIADLIIAEAQELKSGQAGEIADIQQLACAAEMIWCWRTGEESVAAGSVMPATALMQSAAKALGVTDDQWGALDAAKKHIGKRAKELGVKNPLDDSSDDTAKAAIAQEDTSVDTVTQGTGDLNKAVEDAKAEVTALKKLRAELEDAVAKVLATPVPGGLMLSRNVQVKTPQGAVREDWAAKAAYYRDLAEMVTDRPTADGYRKLAREADEKAALPAT